VPFPGVFPVVKGWGASAVVIGHPKEDFATNYTNWTNYFRSSWGVVYEKKLTQRRYGAEGAMGFVCLHSCA
jgi:hypothetical protein